LTLDPTVGRVAEEFRGRLGRAPRILHIGNIANNAYLNAKLLNDRRRCTRCRIRRSSIDARQRGVIFFSHLSHLDDALGPEAVAPLRSDSFSQPREVEDMDSQVSVNVTPTAKDHLRKLSIRTGMTQVALLSRILEWFAAQPQLIQSGVLGHLHKELREEIGRIILQRLAEPQKKEK
jgi:hypothetical protein